MPTHVGRYRLPNGLKTYEELVRLRCADLADMTPRERAAEEYRLKAAWSASEGRDLYMPSLTPGLWMHVDAWCLHRLRMIADLRQSGARRAS